MMIPIPTSGRVYAVIFIIFLFLWPLIILFNEESVVANIEFIVISYTLTIISYVLNFKMSSSVVLSYWNALCYISGRWRIGFVYLTLFLLIPILFIVHSITFITSVIGIIAGKSFSQKTFIRVVYLFSRRGFDLRNAINTI